MMRGRVAEERETDEAGERGERGVNGMATKDSGNDWYSAGTWSERGKSNINQLIRDHSEKPRGNYE